jgi:hypothetical protein
MTRGRGQSSGDSRFLPAEYGGIEYGGLPVNYRILHQMNHSLLRRVVPTWYAECMKIVIWLAI